MKKLLLALTLAATAVTAHATSQEDCDNYGHIVGSMQVIRNNGGPIGLAHNDLRNLTTASSAQSREYGRTLTEIAEYIWSNPAGNMTRERAQAVGTLVCVEKYRK